MAFGLIPRAGLASASFQLDSVSDFPLTWILVCFRIDFGWLSAGFRLPRAGLASVSFRLDSASGVPLTRILVCFRFDFGWISAGFRLDFYGWAGFGFVSAGFSFWLPTH